MRSLSIFAALLIIVPLLVPPLFWPLAKFYSGYSSIAIVFFILSLFLIFARGREFINLSHASVLPVFVFGCVFISHYANSLSISVDYNWSLVTISTLFFLVFVFGDFFERHGRDQCLKQLAFFLVLGCFFYSLVSLFLYFNFTIIFGLEVGQSGGRLKGIYGQPNLTTSALWLGFVSALYLLSFDCCSFKRNLCWVSIFFILWVVALSASRLNFLFLISVFCISILAFFGGGQRGKRIQFYWFFGAALMVLSLLMFPVVTNAMEEFLVKWGLWSSDKGTVFLTDRAEGDEARILEHVKIFNSLSDFSLRQWIFGVGNGQYAAFSFGQPVYQAGGSGGMGTYSHSHNLFSNVLVEWGLLGLAIVLIIFWSIIRRLWDVREKEYSIYIATSLSIIFLHSMTEYPLWYPWFLFVSALFILPLYSSWRLTVRSDWLLPCLGVIVLLVTLLVSWNVVSNVGGIQAVAMSKHRTDAQYRQLTILANDSLVGPYAVLTKYRAFAPDKSNLKLQLREARQIAQWRPLDLVKVREVTLLLMLDRIDQACSIGRNTAEHYPTAAPIIVEKAVRITSVDMAEVAIIANCVEEGLKVWDETLDSMQKKNQKRIDALRSQEQALSSKGRPGWQTSGSGT